MRIADPLSKDWLVYYGYIPCILIVLLTVATCYREVYAVIAGKPILTVDDTFIYDFAGDVKYYWKDIREIYERDSFLFIDLYHPEEYLNKIGNPAKRLKVKLWFKPDSKRSSFVINIDNVAKDPTELLKILNDYSIEAEN